MKKNADAEQAKARPRGLSLEESFRWHMPGDPPAEGCWEWAGTRFSTGYGMLKWGGKCLGAHRVSYSIFKGEVSKGLVIRHAPIVCDNPLCVNPNHLSVGTVRDNSADAIASGLLPRGVAHHASKLTEEKVREARKRYARGDIGLRPLAAEYGVARQVLRQAIRGETWTHVT